MFTKNIFLEGHTQIETRKVTLQTICSYTILNFLILLPQLKTGLTTIVITVIKTIHLDFQNKIEDYTLNCISGLGTNNDILLSNAQFNQQGG